MFLMLFKTVKFLPRKMNLISSILLFFISVIYFMTSECLEAKITSTVPNETSFAQNISLSHSSHSINSSLHVVPSTKIEKTGFFQNLATKICNFKNYISQSASEYIVEKVVPFFEKIFAPKFVVSIYETRSVLDGNLTQASNQSELVAQNAEKKNIIVPLNQFPKKTQPREIIDLVEREMRRKPHSKPQNQSTEVEKKKPTSVIVVLKKIVKAVIRAIKSLLNVVVLKSVRLAINTDDDGPHTTIAFNMNLLGTALHFTVNGGE